MSPAPRVVYLETVVACIDLRPDFSASKGLVADQLESGGPVGVGGDPVRGGPRSGPAQSVDELHPDATRAGVATGPSGEALDSVTLNRQAIESVMPAMDEGRFLLKTEPTTMTDPELMPWYD
jgi:hypothetical protein